MKETENPELARATARLQLALDEALASARTKAERRAAVAEVLADARRRGLPWSS